MKTAYEALLVTFAVILSFLSGLLLPFLAKRQDWNAHWAVGIAVAAIAALFTILWFSPILTRRPVVIIHQDSWPQR